VRRVAVFATALVIRCAVAAVAFGSVETIANFRDTVRLLSGFKISAPYLPAIELWLWAGSVITYSTSLPVAFAHKFLPIFFDALIALLLFDAARDARTALRRGLLYAFAVVPIIVCAIQPQWDSVFVYFLLLALVFLRDGSTRGDAYAGVAWTLSVIAKPLAGPLFILLVPRTWRRGRAFVAGSAITSVVYAIILAFNHALPTPRDFLGIASYASRGVLLFGLPYRPWNRLAMVLLTLGAVTVLHVWKQLDREVCVMLYFAGAIGFSGLCPQYLMWIVPFALLCGRDRFFALYTLAAGTFLVFFYQCPVVNLPNGENLGAFALLRPLGAFSPPLPSPAVLPFVRFLGNLAVPLLCLGLVAFEIWRVFSRPTHDQPEAPPGLRTLAVPPLLAALVFGGAVVWATLQPPLRVEPFILRIQQKIEAYDVVRWRGPTMMERGSKIWVARSLVDPNAAHPFANIATLFLAWTALVSLAALKKNPASLAGGSGASRTSAAAGSLWNPRTTATPPI
jgi:hypothetical protein